MEKLEEREASAAAAAQASQGLAQAGLEPAAEVQLDKLAAAAQALAARCLSETEPHW